MKKKHQGLEGMLGKITGHEKFLNQKTIFFLIVLVVVALDRLTKYLALHFLSNEFNVIPGFFNLKFAINTGAGFGLLQGKTVFLSIISVLFIIFIIASLETILSEDYYWAAACILGGAIANLFDRVFFGFVIDFVSISYFPVFNFADTAITVGAVALIVYIIRDYVNGRKSKNKKHADA